MARKKEKDLVTQVQEKGDLPVYEKKGLNEDEPISTQEKAPVKEHKVITKAQMEEAVLNGKYASYVEVKDSKKIIRFNPNPNEGLKSEVVEYQMHQGLVNTKPAGSTKKIPMIFITNIFTFFNVLMMAIAAWLIASAIITNSPITEALKQLFFVVIITINTIVSIVQEIKAKKTIDKLSVLNAPTARVIRDGDQMEIAIHEVVLDDILFLQSGKQIPSDAIVVEGGVEVNESLLTGESDSIVKNVGDVLHSGSYIVSGSCKARVERVGKDNYIEKLTSQAKKYRKPKSDLMKTLHNLILFMAVIIVPLGTFVFLRMWSGANMGGSHEYMYAVSHTAGAVVGMIPSGLFLCTSIALESGVIRLEQYNTLVQDLYCIEMLSRVDVLCLDKTGTITDGSMNVVDVLEYKNDTGLNLKNAISAINNALEDQTITTKALDAKFGRGKRVRVKNTIPFSSARKFSAVEFEKYKTYILGAPEFVLKGKYSLVSGDVLKAANKGYRVLLLAHSNNSIVKGNVTGDITPLGLIMIEDNIRSDAIETIQYFKESGVDVKVISGDNPLTVSKISQRAGIERADHYISLDGLSDKEVIRAAKEYTVFGRVSPSQKKLLVMTLKALGKTVAMTGDGVNDILALREADCSIAMASGSEAARNVSHLVLLDSNFSSMPRVVAEGRRVINNIQKVASIFLTKTIFSLLLAIYSLMRCDYPIQTNQLFIIEWFVIGIPSFFLALEPNNRKIEGKFIKNVIKNALPGAIVIAVSTALIFALQGLLGLTDEENRTIIVLNATFTCYVVLFKVCKPFNIMRRFLFAAMAFLGFLVLVFLPNLLNIVQVLPIRLAYLPGTIEQMSSTGILLTLVTILSAYPAMHFVQNIRGWSKQGIDYFVKSVAKTGEDKELASVRQMIETIDQEDREEQ